MNTSDQPETQLEFDRIRSLPFFRSNPPSSIERLSGGKNNRVYKVRLSNGETRALKFYFVHASDARDRLGAEFGSLTFLWDRGVRSIAQPIAMDREEHAALYSFIDGTTKPCEELSIHDLDCAIAFVSKLRQLSVDSSAQALGGASEANFSVAKSLQVIEKRFDILNRAALQLQTHSILQIGLRHMLSDLTAFFSEIRSWIAMNVRQNGHTIEDELPQQNRVLSPSDFGFHNGLLLSDGSWAFLDFEYFGWDDPAKMISDFLLHPGMKLSPSLQSYFLNGMMPIFKDDEGFMQRLQVTYPLCAIKWCAIILNEFVPEFQARRGFAEMAAEDLQLRQSAQLTKAQALLDTVRSHYNKFCEYFEIA